MNPSPPPAAPAATPGAAPAEDRPRYPRHRSRARRNDAWQRLLDLAEARPTRAFIRRAGRLLARAHRARVEYSDPLRTLARRLLDRLAR